jgi:hypothetical protein
LVIQDLGWNLECACLGSGASFCDEACGPIRLDWVIAFAMADAPHRELAVQRAQSRGLIVKEFDDRDGYSYVRFGQDLEQAAAELACEVDTDPISYEAARYLVASQIRLGQPIPKVLRDWAANTMEGIEVRPHKKGKYRGAAHRRDRMIVALINDIIELTSLDPTSVDREKGMSACNAVADGFRLLRRKPASYEAVVKIWGNRRELQRVTLPEKM